MTRTRPTTAPPSFGEGAAAAAAGEGVGGVGTKRRISWRRLSRYSKHRRAGKSLRASPALPPRTVVGACRFAVRCGLLARHGPRCSRAVRALMTPGKPLCSLFPDEQTSEQEVVQLPVRCGERARGRESLSKASRETASVARLILFAEIYTRIVFGFTHVSQGVDGHGSSHAIECTQSYSTDVVSEPKSRDEIFVRPRSSSCFAWVACVARRRARAC